MVSMTLMTGILQRKAADLLHWAILLLLLLLWWLFKGGTYAAPGVTIHM